MAGFIYYISEPDKNKAREKLAALKFPFEVSLPGNGVIKGPDGKPGRTFGLAQVAAAIAYFPDHQVWRPSVVSDGAWWIGMQKDERPTPAELVKHEAVEGTPVKDADGYPWIVPVVRDWLGTCKLNHRYGVSEEGRTERVLEGGADMRELWGLAKRVFEVLILRQDDGHGEFTLAEAWRAVSLAISVNYYAGHDELAHCGGMSDIVIRLMLHELADFAKLQRIKERIDKENDQKKTARHTKDSSDSTSPRSECGLPA